MFWFFIAVHWASRCRAQALGHVGSVVVEHGLSCSTACGSFLDRDRSSLLCIARWMFNHCTIREAPDNLYFYIYLSIFALILGKISAFIHLRILTILTTCVCFFWVSSFFLFAYLVIMLEAFLECLVIHSCLYLRVWTIFKNLVVSLWVWVSLSLLVDFTIGWWTGSRFFFFFWEASAPNSVCPLSP